MSELHANEMEDHSPRILLCGSADCLQPTEFRYDSENDSYIVFHCMFMDALRVCMEARMPSLTLLLTISCLVALLESVSTFYKL